MLDTTKSDTIMSFTKVNIRFDQKTLITLYCKFFCNTILAILF